MMVIRPEPAEIFSNAVDTKARALARHLSTHTKNFDWHSDNCTHFCARFIAEIEGRDPLAGFQMPTSKSQARRLLRKELFADLVSAALGRAHLPAAFAQVGDLVLLPLSPPDPLSLALGLCAGDTTALRTDTAGPVAFLPTASGLCCWRIGAVR